MQQITKMKVRMPLLFRQFLAEFWGTFFLVLIGDGSIAQKTMGLTQFDSVAFGYGLALMVGILVSGGVSGGHLNPAVTFSMTCIGKCKIIQLPVYWAAQYLGAFLAASVLFGIYADGITLNGGKTLANAGIFASYPASAELSTTTLVFDQMLGTAILVVIILAVTDSKNMKVPSGLVPLLIGLGLTSIHLSFAYNAGCAVNPARDFSPRLFTMFAKFGSPWYETFLTFDYFFWIPWLIPHLGGLIGAVVYYFSIEMFHKDEDDE